MAVYWNGWQYIHTEEEPPDAIDTADGRQDVEGLGVFTMLGLGDPDTNPVEWSVTVGLSGRGLLEGRGDDTYGLGYFDNRLQEPRSFLPSSALAGSAQGVEAYYNIALLRSTALTFDFQWLKSAFAAFDDAIVLGMRLNMSF